jgi:hypothetical protein
MSDKDKMAKYRTEIQQVSYYAFTLFPHQPFLSLSSSIFRIRDYVGTRVVFFFVLLFNFDGCISGPFELKLLPHMQP